MLRYLRHRWLEVERIGHVRLERCAWCGRPRLKIK